MHPLVELTVYLGLSIFSLAVDSMLGWGIVLTVFSFIVIGHRLSVRTIWLKMRHVTMVYPLLLGLFVLSSLLFTNETLGSALNRGLFAIIRFFLATAIITAYLEMESRKMVLASIRTIWISMKFSIKRIEDFFLFLTLTMRFFPAIQRDWKLLDQSRSVLGLKVKKNKIAQIKDTVDTLPGILLMHLKKAKNTALAMSLRGYGSQIPRGVTNPIPLYPKDIFQLSLILFTMIGLGLFAKI